MTWIDHSVAWWSADAVGQGNPPPNFEETPASLNLSKKPPLLEDPKVSSTDNREIFCEVWRRVCVCEDDPCDTKGGIPNPTGIYLSIAEQG